MTDYAADPPHAHPLDGDVVAAGQPSSVQLEKARAAGIRTVVNLRPSRELNTFDEAALVVEAGMHYVHIPIAGPDDIDDENARTLDSALADGNRPAIVHCCASSNRLGVLMAYRARYLQGKNSNEAHRRVYMRA